MCTGLPCMEILYPSVQGFYRNKVTGYNTYSAAEKEVDNQRLTNKTNKLTEVEKIALASVMVFIVVSIIFFTGGFLCRHYNNKIMHCYKERHPGVTETLTALPTTPAEDLHEDNDTRHVELELQTNVAYENVPMN